MLDNMQGHKVRRFAAFVVVFIALALIAIGVASSQPPQTSNNFGVSITAIDMPRCAYVNHRTPFYFLLKSTSTEEISTITTPLGIVGDKAMLHSFARPSLRGSADFLYWPVTLKPGQTKKLQINLVIPDWVTGGNKGPILFDFAVQLDILVNGTSGPGRQIVVVQPEFCVEV